MGGFLEPVGPFRCALGHICKMMALAALRKCA